MALNKFSTSLRTALLATAAIAGLAALPSTANAVAYGLAETTITNMALTVSGPANPFSSFNFSTATSNNLNDGNGNILAVASSNSPVVTGAAYNFGTGNAGLDACFAAGTGCAAANATIAQIGSNHFAPANTAATYDTNFVPVNKGGATANYAFSASAIPITTINNTAGTLAVGGFAKQIAESSTAGGIHGSATSGTAIQNWTFAAHLSATETVSFTYSALVHLLSDSTDALAGDVTSSSTIKFVLQNLDTDGSTTNGGLPDNLSRTSHPIAGQNLKAGDFNGGVALTLNVADTLNGGTCAADGCNILVDIELTDKVTTNSTPEPATLGLMGMGLLGLGAAVRRRRAKTAA